MVEIAANMPMSVIICVLERERMVLLVEIVLVIKTHPFLDKNFAGKVCCLCQKRWIQKSIKKAPGTSIQGADAHNEYTVSSFRTIPLVWESDPIDQNGSRTRSFSLITASEDFHLALKQTFLVNMNL